MRHERDATVAEDAAQFFATAGGVGTQALLQVEHDFEQIVRRGQPDDGGPLPLERRQNVALGFSFALKPAELLGDRRRTVAVRDEVHELVDLIDHAVEPPPVLSQLGFAFTLEFAQAFGQALARVSDALVRKQPMPEFVK